MARHLDPRRRPEVPTAAGIRGRIAVSPGAPLLVTIVGPGGTGKSTVLDTLVAEYEAAGVPVHHLGRGTPADGALDDTAPTLDRGSDGLPLDAVLAVDGAHLLPAATLDALARRVRAGSARLLLAYRPWPRPAGLATLTAAMAGGQHVVVLGHLDRDAVARRICDMFGCEPTHPLVDLVHEQSGGLPVLIGLVARAVHDSGRFDPARPEAFRRPERVTVSVPLAERLRHRVDALDPAVCRVLEALAVGAPLDAKVLTELLGVDGDELADTVAATQATGLVTDDGAIVPFVRSLLLRLMPMLRSRELQLRLAELELAGGGCVLAAGRRLAGTGATGTRVAAVLTAAAAEAEARHEPACVVAELLTAAVDAGAAPRELAGRRARAAALDGDLDEALRLADGVLADPLAPDHAVAVATVAAVLSHRGLADRAAELCCGLSPRDGVQAVPLLVGGGHVEAARALLAATGKRFDAGCAVAADRQPASSAPGRVRPAPTPHAGAVSPLPAAATLVGGAVELLARGVLATLDAPAPVALSQLVRATAMLDPVAATVLLPDTPAALTALFALHCGEFDVADATLARATECRHSGRIARPRHLLLRGWLAMLRGHTEQARALLERSGAREPRDEMLAAGLAVGLARRDGTGLDAQWSRARTALVGHPVDLYTLLPLGECAVAAAQLGAQDRLAVHLAQAHALLARLGTPGAWSAPLRWALLHAALATDDVAGAREHAAALAGGDGPYAAALAVAAGVWCDLAAGTVDAAAVQEAGRGLHDVGLGGEGARLVGSAAASTADRRRMAELHACARELHPPSAPREAPSEPLVPPDAPATVIPAPRSPRPDDDLQLTDRELEIGGLILAGLTYRQIGARLFLSEKTVEHHVGRIRRRLGVGSRKELFGRLRALLPAQS